MDELNPLSAWMKDDKPTVFAVKGAAEGCAASWSQQGGNPSKTEYMY